MDPLLFDACLFDLDGTLVATDRFWVQAARTGARRAFADLGLEREVPDAEAWMSLVGLSVEDGFRQLFPELSDEARRAVAVACTEEEHRLLDAGGAALMPGAREALGEMAAAGLRLGIASNCSQAYLDHMLRELGLEAFVEHALCLDSPGIRDKADMLERLLARFDTRAAVMVGDRTGDRDAAWQNGIPHVHCAFGFAARGETVAAEAEIEDLGELVGRMRRRAAWIQEALALAGALAGPESPPFALGVTGEVAAGKTLFARDAARLLRDRGHPAVAVSVDAWRREPLPARPEALEDLVDLPRLEAELLEPRARGEAVRLPGGAAPDAEDELPPGATLVLEGLLLLEPRVHARLDRVLHLDLPEPLVWRRLVGRDGRREGPAALAGTRDRVLPARRAHALRYRPERLADLVLDASNPLGAAPLPAEPLP